MENLLVFIISFVLVYLIYLLFIILRKKQLTKFRNGTEVKYLEKKYKLNIEEIKIKKLAHTIALSNAFIISIVLVIVGFIDNIILKMLTGFIILIPLILIIYHIIGLHYRKKGNYVRS